jgi:hypothetical protein
MATYYRHTGRITAKGLMLGLLAGCGTAIALSVPYAYITVYVPIVYANLLATVGFGLVVGLAAARAARAGDLQSAPAYALVGIVAGLVAEYFNWVFWIFALSHQKLFTLDPWILYEIAGEILPEGTWGLGRSGNVTDIALLLVWIVEGGMILGIAAYTTVDGLRRFICCPACTAWFDKPIKTHLYELPDDPEPVAAQVRDLKLKCLLDLKPIPEGAGASNFLSLDLFFCPACNHFGCLTLARVETVKAKDEEKTYRKPLVERLVLPAAALPELKGAS